MLARVQWQAAAYVFAMLNLINDSTSSWVVGWLRQYSHVSYRLNELYGWAILLLFAAAIANRFQCRVFNVSGGWFAGRMADSSNSRLKKHTVYAHTKRNDMNNLNISYPYEQWNYELFCFSWFFCRRQNRHEDLHIAQNVVVVRSRRSFVVIAYGAKLPTWFSFSKSA